MQEIIGSNVLSALHFLSKLCHVFEPCFSFRRISLPGQSDFLAPTDSAMNFNQPLLGLCIVLTCNLLGCEDGVFYSSLSDALSALCDGSSCPVSCKCCLEKQYALAEECINGMAAGGEKPDACSSCISSATPDWEPQDCKTHRNLGYCGTQFWNNQAGKCDKYNETCGDR